MAAPDATTIRDLSGTWVMNKTLSDDPDPILQLQGIGWFLRTAIGLATITLHAKQYVTEDGVTHIDIDQTATGGIKGTSENRELDWQFRKHSDYIFGAVQGRSRFIKLEDVEDEFLKSGWLDEIKQDVAIQNYVESLDAGWIANQIWGFELIEGRRHYVRHVVVTKGDKREQARLVYDYVEAQDDTLDIAY
ncbi:hypothetical protein L228DRAFT_242344 [Xylona heveae TC161]|uniref:Lipocalin-like domain-containing protein n=1 Tax=Xylona heveae (strain CBS 132557 / TC161) TaxID=1328760 RepID=A0A165JA11_XYLHT|nr:hypothetical protein L228DRAFT_242344 [Xylona heveae TC161]KZF25955.1 hypothetical protein L228DRAFT_242344 [Xylona heveae TC161]